MARTTSSGNYLERSSAVVGAIPVTIAAWANQTGSSSGQQGVFGIGGNTTGVALCYDSGSVKFMVNGTFRALSGVSPTGWASLVGVLSSSSASKVYVDGAGTAGTGEAWAPSAVTAVGRRGTGNAFNGSVAEVAAWNVALTDAEASMLALGVSPLLVRPESLVWYLPLMGRYSPEIDVVGGLGLTLTGTPAYADHPRVYRPRGRASVFVPAAGGGGGGNRRRRVILCGGR